MDGHDHLDPRLQRNVRIALDEAAADLDRASVARLREARRRALDAASSPRRPYRPWLAVSVPVAAAVVLAVLLIDAPWRSTSSPGIAAPADAVRDLDLLTSGENLDLLEDLDFYLWLPPGRQS